VGGGDFLVYYDEAGTYQHFKGMTTYHWAHGPNLSDVSYTGVTADGHIAATYRVSTPRTDDYLRNFHHVRYDVLKPTPFQRLAFYQIGSDYYNASKFNLMARGNEEGMAEQWTPERGGDRYRQTAIALTGRVPWLSLHDVVHDKPEDKAPRGLIVRSWKARLGGRDVPTPFFSVYGSRKDRVSVELSAPPEVEQLLPGDYLDAELEFVVIPGVADSYYGTNSAFRDALKEDANTWKPLLREALGNDLQVRAVQGKVVHHYPVVIETDASQEAVVEINGGVGYVPITFTGLKSYRGFRLFQTRDGKPTHVDQGVSGNDFWQTDYDSAAGTWRITYNVPLESDPKSPRAVQFRFCHE
jgi:hypothetical protein